MSAAAAGEKRGREHDDADSKSKHLNFMAKRLRAQLNDLAFTDVTFLVDGEQVGASRAILSASSDYFRSLLSRSFGEAHDSSTPITIANVRKDVFLLCLEFLYCGSICADMHQIQPLLFSADMYQIQPLFGVGVHFFENLTDFVFPFSWICHRFLT